MTAITWEDSSANIDSDYLADHRAAETLVAQMEPPEIARLRWLVQQLRREEQS